MRRFTNTKALARTVAVVGAVMVLVGGVTFAALQSERSVLKGNTISTATAGLQLSSDGEHFSNLANGFNFSGIMPGHRSPTWNVYLKNTGQTRLNVRFGVGRNIDNPDGVNLANVKILVALQGGGGETEFPLDQLTSTSHIGGVPLGDEFGPLQPGETRVYTFQVDMDETAFNGPSATLSNLDFNFDATATN